MRVLITGHLGFIGAVMVPLMQEAGHDVTGLDIGLYDGCDFGAPAAPIREIRADIRDVDGSLIQGFDAVIHLAALSNDPLGDLDAQLTYDINHLATVRLATLARDAGVSRFLFSSSCSNYGAAGDTMLDENSAFNPVTPYGVSKVRAENDLLKLASERYSPVLLRSATAYGVSPRLRSDIVLNNLTAYAVATGKVLIKSDGTPWRPIVHVEDICRAFIAALEAPRDAIHAQAFNVGRPEENFRVRQLAEFVRDTVPACELEFAGDASPDTRNYRVDCSKIARVLPSFRPQWTARKGAAELYEAYKRRGISVEDIEGHRYRRIGEIKRLLSSGKLDGALRWAS
jgi:nucleoside-diphosphate-sugar epimerase